MVTGLPPAHDMGAAAPDAAPESRGQRAPAWLASLLLHVLVIGLLIGFWRWETREEPPSIEIALVPGNGAAGAEGGSSGGAEAGPAREGNAEVTSTAPASDSTPLPVSVEAPPQSPPAEEKPQPAESTAAPELPSSPPRKPAPPVKAAPPRPQPAQAASAPTPAPTPGTPGSGAGAGGAAGRGTGVAGAGSAAMGSGDLRAIGDDYLDRLRRHIRRFMAYPQAAKKQKQQGEVVVTVLLRRDGTVLDARVAQSSGFPMLDDAAVKAVRDSSKVPPFPDQYPKAEGSIDLPFEFHIGFLDRVFN